jgi:hypothetical protein
VLTEQDHQLIDRYLKGELDDATQRLFDDRMLDSQFSKEVIYRRDLHQALRHRGRVLLKEELQAIENQSSRVFKRKTINTRWLAVAASVALVVTTVYFLFTNTSEQDLYAEYFQPVPNVVAPITKGGGTNTDYNAAFRAYELGDYDRAVGLLQDLDQSDAAVSFFLAITYMHLDRLQAASSSLNQIAKNDSAPYQRHAQWFLMLAEYRLGATVSSDSLLTILTGEIDHPYHTEAVGFRLKK